MKPEYSYENIDGVILTELEQITDHRGSVLHMLRNDDSMFKKFGEIYFSEVFPGAVKAWKFHFKQTQNIAVPVGRVRFVVYDDRLASPTLGKLQVIELGRPDLYRRLMLPPKLWYGFTCISENPALLANCSDLPHEPGESQIMNFRESSIPYIW